MSEAPNALIVCPMEIERAALAEHRAIRAARVVVCGPGSAAVGRWAKGVTTAPSLVILAGVAGGLAPELAAGEAAVVHEVIDDRGMAVPCPLQCANARKGWRVASVASVITTPAAKQALRARTGAHIVDLESAAFAREVSARGWSWAIVRGVSDTVTDALPPEIETLVDARGRTRTLAAAALVIRKPSLVPQFRLLGQRTAEAMRNVAAIIEVLLAEHATARAGA